MYLLIKNYILGFRLSHKRCLNFFQLYFLGAATNCKNPLMSACMTRISKCMIFTFLFSKKPECTSDPECPDHLACIREKCQNPCFTTTCGVNAECRVTRHRAICYCKQGYEGDPYRICEERKQYII